MTRSLKPIAASAHGVNIMVTPQARRRVRRAARAAAVVGGYAAGVAAVTMLCVAAAQSALLVPIILCGGIACVVTLRCIKNSGGNQDARKN
jgi:uncharacterized membrane protein YoaK (UPF0700 family)